MSKPLSEAAETDLFGPDEEEPTGLTGEELQGGTPGPDLSHIAPDLRALAIPLTDLIPDPANARQHNEKNLTALAASLGSFQQVKNIVVQRKPDGTLIVRAGNGTLTAALALGWTHVAVVKQDWDDITATAFGIADNRIAELAEWDASTLPQLLKVLTDEGYGGMDALGFSDEDLEGLLADVPEPLEWSEAFGNLPEGARTPIQQMMFILSDDQVERVRLALSKAKAKGKFGETGNGNSNGNALARIVEAYLGQG